MLTLTVSLLLMFGNCVDDVDVVDVDGGVVVDGVVVDVYVDGVVEVVDVVDVGVDVVVGGGVVLGVVGVVDDGVDCVLVFVVVDLVEELVVFDVWANFMMMMLVMWLVLYFVCSCVS